MRQLERAVPTRRHGIGLYIIAFAAGVAYGLLSAIAVLGWWL